MRILKPEAVKINFDGVDREFLFTLNVIDELQETFDMPIDEIMRGVFSTSPDGIKKSHKLLRGVVTALCNDDAERRGLDKVTVEYIGGVISLANLGQIAAIALRAFTGSLPPATDESAEAGESGNAQSG